MRAVVAARPGGPEVLTVVEVPRPVPGPGEVLIRVIAAGVNRADTVQREGHYPPPPGVTNVLGLECSGEVVEVDKAVTTARPGDQVCALLAGGGYAEYVAVPAGQVVPVPGGQSMIEAAGIMETAATVWSNVFELGGLISGQTLLVHGGTSGIGTMAIQLAKAAGAAVVTTAGSPVKVRACEELGADLAINYREQDFARVMGSRGLEADVVLDIVGGDYLLSNVEVLANGGTLVVIGLQGGARGELALDQLMRRRATLAATSLRARPESEKASIVAATAKHVCPLLEDGSVRVVVHDVFALEDVSTAHEAMGRSDQVGKLVLTL